MIQTAPTAPSAPFSKVDPPFYIQSGAPCPPNLLQASVSCYQPCSACVEEVVLQLKLSPWVNRTFRSTPILFHRHIHACTRVRPMNYFAGTGIPDIDSCTSYL